MENIVKLESKNYLIFRLSNVIGKSGSCNTIINFLLNKIKSNQKFYLWKNASRNIIDIADICKIVSYIIEKNLFNSTTINIAYDHNNKIADIVKAIEDMLNKKAVYTIDDKGIDLKIDNSKIQLIMRELEINQPTINELVKKYKI